MTIENLDVAAFDIEQQPAILSAQHGTQNERNPNDKGFTRQQNQRAQRIVDFEQPDHVFLFPRGLWLGPVFLIGLVVVARVRHRICISAVENDSNQRILGKLQPRAARHIGGGSVRAHNHQHAVASLGQHAGIGNRHRRRGVDNNPVEQGFHPLHKELQPPVRHQFRRD